MTARRVLVAGHDTGALNVLAILLQEWSDDPAIEAWFMGTPAMVREVRWRVPNARIVPWASQLTETVAADMRAMDQLVGREVRAADWDGVLCGTSAMVMLERRLVRHARMTGIPVLSYCDMWFAYADRYVCPDGWAVPDVVLTVDARMSAEMAALPWPAPPAFHAVGHPLYEQSRHRRVGHDPRGDVIRFLSEPSSSRFPMAGIDEFELAEEILLALRSTGSNRRLAIRTHPVDQIEPWRRFVWRHRADGVELDVTPLDVCLVDTWAAIGISSVLLVEMGMAGIPVASFQPPQADQDYFCLPFDEFGIARLSDRGAVARWLTSADATLPLLATSDDSKSRIRAAMLDLMRTRERMFS